MNRFGTLALTGALLGPALAIAGAATGSVSASLTIPGITAGGGAAAVGIGQFLAVNPATGAVFVNRAVGALAEVRPLGVFTFNAVDDDTPKLYNRSTGLYQQATGTVIRWDSFARDDGTWTNETAVGANSASSFSFVVAANVDPFITYGLSVTNNTNSTSNYSFVFNESLVPAVSGPYTIYSDISGSLVQSTSSSPLALGATVGTTIQKVFLNDSNAGVSFSAGVDVGNAQSFGNPNRGALTYNGNGLQSATANGTSGIYTYNSWEVRTDFSLTGGRDVATLSGYAEIAPIPELETYAMLVGGLMGMAMILRRRNAGTAA